MRNRNNIQIDIGDNIQEFIRKYPYYYAWLRYHLGRTDDYIIKNVAKGSHVYLNKNNEDAIKLYRENIEMWMKGNGLVHFIQK